MGTVSLNLSLEDLERVLDLARAYIIYRRSAGFTGFTETEEWERAWSNLRVQVDEQVYG